MRIRSALSAIGFGCVLVLWPAGRVEAVAITKGPYLQNVTSDSITVMWETDAATSSRVDYGIAGPNEQSVTDPTAAAIHEVLVTPLLPDTMYQYTVTSGAATSEQSTFGTAPQEARSFRFAVYGDTRSQPSVHAAVVQAIIAGDPEIVLHVGDLVTLGRLYTQWGPEFFTPAGPLLIDTPLYPALGNHEYAWVGQVWFFDLFSLPNNEQWYAFTYSNTRFVALDTNVAYGPGSAQYEWLQAELQSAVFQSADWQIVYFHHPAFTASHTYGDTPAVKQHLVPLFEQYGVDLVFAGHTHAYERYYHNGIHYIVTGGGGGPLDELPPDTEAPIRLVGASVYHHCVVDVNVPERALVFSARANDGSELDSFTAALPALAEPTCAALVIHRLTGRRLFAIGYADGKLELRDWGGDLVAVRYGFGEVTAIASSRQRDSALPRLYVGSTDSGGALRVIDPADIHSDLAARFGFGAITSLLADGQAVYVGSGDSGGTLRKLATGDLSDQAVRNGFGEVTAIGDGWDSGNGDYLLVGSTDSGGVLRRVDLDTLLDTGPGPRYGFGRIYDLASADMDGDGNAEVVIASSDGGGTVRLIELPDLAGDVGARYGFGTIYDVAYGPVGTSQSWGDGTASVVAGSADGGGALRVMEVQTVPLASTLTDTAARFGFGPIAAVQLDPIFATDTWLVQAVTTDGGSVAAHIMDENLADLAGFVGP